MFIVSNPFGYGLITLTLVLLNKVRCHTRFKFSANQITRSRLLLYIHILNDKQCRSRSVGFFRSQLIWIYTVCKGRVYSGSAGQGLRRFDILGTLYGIFQKTDNFYDFPLAFLHAKPLLKRGLKQKNLFPSEANSLLLQ